MIVAVVPVPVTGRKNNAILLTTGVTLTYRMLTALTPPILSDVCQFVVPSAEYSVMDPVNAVVPKFHALEL